MIEFSQDGMFQTRKPRTCAIVEETFAGLLYFSARAPEKSMNILEMNKLSVYYSSHASRRALLMSGCAVASWYFGCGVPELIDVLHSGYVHAVSTIPLAHAVTIASIYFNGAMTFFGEVAMTAADRFVDLGGILSDQAAVTMEAIRSHISSGYGIAQDVARDTYAGAREAGIFWRTAVSGTIAPIRDGAIEMAGSLGGFLWESAKDVGGMLTKAIEGFAVAKSLYEAYSWTMGKIWRKSRKQEATLQAADNSGLSVDTVTNMTINISIGGADAADKAHEHIENILNSTGSKAVVDREALRDALDKAIAADHIAARKQSEERHAERESHPGSNMIPRPPTGKPGILFKENLISLSTEVNEGLRSSVNDAFRSHQEALSKSGTFKPLTDVDSAIVGLRSEADRVYVKQDLLQWAGASMQLDLRDADGASGPTLM